MPWKRARNFAPERSEPGLAERRHSHLAAAAETEDIIRIFDEHRIPWRTLEEAQLPQALRQGSFAAALINAEKLERLDLDAIRALLEPQSDFWFILLVDRDCPLDFNALQPMVENSMLLERPLAPAFLVHCARTALRAHARQL